jgi:hypothetical protein
MHKGAGIVLAVVMFLVPGLAIGATALWNPPTQNEDNTPLTDLAGFNLYEITSGARTKVNAVLIPTSLCAGSPATCTYALPSGSAVKGDRFVMTAVDAAGNESEDSLPATYNVKPKVPAGLIVRP